MQDKRITIVSGHYGSGKTNFAVNLALDLRRRHANTAIADIDIVNPYFRSKDSEALLKTADIRLICSEYANTNVDIPALPQQMYAVTDDQTLYSVLDVGGDERGALALGRIAPKIAAENDYDMLFVVNCYRPLTRDADSTIEVMREIEAASRLSFTAIVNNSNLGYETTAQDVLHSVAYAEEIAQKTGLKVRYTTVHPALSDALKDKINNLYPVTLQEKMIKEDLS